MPRNEVRKNPSCECEDLSVRSWGMTTCFHQAWQATLKTPSLLLTHLLPALPHTLQVLHILQEGSPPADPQAEVTVPPWCFYSPYHSPSVCFMH